MFRILKYESNIVHLYPADYLNILTTFAFSASYLLDNQINLGVIFFFLRIGVHSSLFDSLSTHPKGVRRISTPASLLSCVLPLIRGTVHQPATWVIPGVCAHSLFAVSLLDKHINDLRITRTPEHLAHRVVNINVSKLTDKLSPLFFPRSAIRYDVFKCVLLFIIV